MAISLSLPQGNSTTPTYHKLVWGEWQQDTGNLTVQYESYVEAADWQSAQGNNIPCQQTASRFVISFPTFLTATITGTLETVVDSMVLALPNSPLVGGTEVV